MGEIRLGRIAGFPLAVNWSVLAIVWLLTWGLATGPLPDAAPGYAPVVYWLVALAGALLLVASLLAHELAHAVMAQRAGVEVQGLTLWLFGGIASLGGEASTPADDLRIAIVGPATSLGLSAGFGLVTVALDAVGVADLVVGVTAWLAGINLLLAVFNLVPGAPLDGGRVLRALLWRRHGDRVRAAVSATRAGRVVAFGLIWVGLMELLAGAGIGGLWLALIGWFVLNAARAEEADVLARDVLRDVRVADVMSPHPNTAPAWLTIDAFVEDYVLGRRHSAYPVEGTDGRVVGLVSLTQLRAVPFAARRTTCVGDVAVPLARVPTAAPDEKLLVLVGRLAPETGGRALVLRGEELVGIVTPTDVTRTLEAQSLRDGSPRPSVASRRRRHRRLPPESGHKPRARAGGPAQAEAFDPGRVERDARPMTT